jgi:hypothetical protein
VSLVRESKLLFLTHIVDVSGVVLLNGILAWLIFALLFNGFDFLDQMLMLME